MNLKIIFYIKNILKINFIFTTLYYIFHKNLFFGAIFKFFSSTYKYNKYKFYLPNNKFPLSLYSSFLFRTYELNDIKIIEKYITNKNKCIIIGAGIGVTSVLANKLSKNKVICFEIDNDLKNCLSKNLKTNNVLADVNINYLSFDSKNKIKFLKQSSNFLENSFFKKKGITKSVFAKNYKNAKFQNFNTLIIDAEGYEYEVIKNISKLKKIKYLIFEMHNKILLKTKVKSIFLNLKVNNFVLKEEFFNTYYFQKL